MGREAARAADRDVALKLSALLVPRIGGPSVNPYTPGDLWREISHYGSTPATAQTFVQDHGEKLYRRSIYTYWKRTAPPPNMMALDAPNREVCTDNRAATTTPLQALVTLNDPQFVEAARHLAQNALACRKTEDEAIDEMATRLLARPLMPKEKAVVKETLAKMRAFYEKQPEATKEFLAVGESDVAGAALTPQLAAMTMVANQLMNLDEVLSK